jgi:hypothetical protein
MSALATSYGHAPELALVRVVPILLQKSFCTHQLTDDLGNAIEGTRISGRRWIFLTAEKLAPSDSGLLQQYRHIAAQSWCCLMSAAGESGQWAVEGECRL